MASDPSVTSLDINVWNTRTMKLMTILSVLLMAVVVDALWGGVRLRFGKKRNAEMTEDAMNEAMRDDDLTPEKKEEMKHDLETKIKEDVEEERLKLGV